MPCLKQIGAIALGVCVCVCVCVCSVVSHELYNTPYLATYLDTPLLFLDPSTYIPISKPSTLTPSITPTLS